MSIARRIARAKEHSDYLGRRYELTTKRRPTFRLETTVESDGLEQVVRIHGAPVTPPEWASVVSEFLHCLRSALDSLMWELVLANGEIPGRETYFPIHLKESNADFDKKTHGVSGDVKAIERAVQPYASKAGPANRDALFLIHELNRLDKHRTIPVVTVAVTSSEVDIPKEAVGCPIVSTLQPLFDGAEVCRFRLLRPLPLIDWDVRVVNLTTFVLETETTPYLPFPGELRLLHGAMQRVVDQLRSHAPG